MKSALYVHCDSRFTVRLNLADVCKTGYSFCLLCQRITERMEREGVGLAGVCLHCGSPRLRWNPPIDEPEKVNLGDGI